MSIYDFLMLFWLRNEYDQCSLSEVALYFCLLHEANRQHWVSPFKVSTQMLTARLGTSKQNVMKARDSLMRRGLINYVKGDGKGKPAMYTLLLGSMEINEQPQALPQPLPNKTTSGFTQPLTEALPQAVPLLNIKEESILVEKKKKIDSSHHPLHNNVLTLDKLQEMILADNEWQNDLQKRLSDAGVHLSCDGLKGKINEFFDDLRSRKVSHKDEADCRNHVFNWIRYHNKNNDYGQDSRSECVRAEISDNRPEDYKGYC